jgi:hypothetical protein
VRLIESGIKRLSRSLVSFTTFLTNTAVSFTSAPKTRYGLFNADRSCSGPLQSSWPPENYTHHDLKPHSKGGTWMTCAELYNPWSHPYGALLLRSLKLNAPPIIVKATTIAASHLERWVIHAA